MTDHERQPGRSFDALVRRGGAPIDVVADDVQVLAAEAADGVDEQRAAWPRDDLAERGEVGLRHQALLDPVEVERVPPALFPGGARHTVDGGNGGEALPEVAV